MAQAGTQRDRDEIARRGEEVFQREIRPRVQHEHPQSFVLIDVDTGDYEVDADECAAADRLLARRPQGVVYFRRVGSRFTRRFGGSSHSRAAGDE